MATTREHVERNGRFRTIIVAHNKFPKDLPTSAVIDTDDREPGPGHLYYVEGPDGVGRFGVVNDRPIVTTGYWRIYYDERGNHQAPISAAELREGIIGRVILSPETIDDVLCRDDEP